MLMVVAFALWALIRVNTVHAQLQCGRKHATRTTIRIHIMCHYNKHGWLHSSGFTPSQLQKRGTQNEHLLLEREVSPCNFC